MQDLCRCLRQSGVSAQRCLSCLDALEPVMRLEPVRTIKNAHSTPNPGADTSCQPDYVNTLKLAGPGGHDTAKACTCWPVCLSQTCGRELALQAGKAGSNAHCSDAASSHDREPWAR